MRLFELFESIFESLETRQFLSATLDLGVLSVVGTHKSDNITLTIEDRSPDQVTVKINGFARRFALTDIDHVELDHVGSRRRQRQPHEN